MPIRCRTHCRRPLPSVGLIVALLWPGAAAWAQQAQDPGLSPAVSRDAAQAPPTIASPSTQTLPAPVPVSARSEPVVDVGRFARFDSLEPQGQTTDFPGTYDTLLGDVDGWRSWLYDHDLYFKVVSLSSMIGNVLGEDEPRRPQLYDGQRFTAASNNFFRFAWKIAGSGKDITQLNVSFEDNAVSWDQIGPTGADFLRLDVYSSFLDRRVEVTAGFGGNIVNYVGIFAGGDPILANGLAGTIPIETGMSAGVAGAPLINLQLNGDDGLYDKAGVQRSIGPEGLVEEAKHNGVGLDFTRPGARPLFLEELGILRPASPDERQIWIRAGGLYNLTQYARFDGRGTSRNWNAYVLGDYQIVKPSRTEPYRGVFVGGSALFAPSDVNVYTRTLEARLYAIGMVPGRPTDSATLTLDDNQFSRDGNESYGALGVITQPYQWSASVLYALHAVRGVYVAPSITWFRHPSFVGGQNQALNLGVALTVQL